MLSRTLALTLFVLLVGSAVAQDQSQGNYQGTVEPKCVITPVRDFVTFLQQDTNGDGFVERLDAQSNDRRLLFTLQCSGSKATIAYGTPQRVNTDGPALNSGTRYNTVVTYVGDGGNTSNSTTTTNPNGPGSFTVNVGSTNPRTVSVGFALRNGGDANIPLRAGEYTFLFTTTITAGL